MSIKNASMDVLVIFGSDLLNWNLVSKMTKLFHYSEVTPCTHAQAMRFLSVCVCLCDYETYPRGFDCLGVLRVASKREVRSFIVRFCLPLSFTLGQTFTSREQTTGGQPAVNTHIHTHCQSHQSEAIKKGCRN